MILSDVTIRTYLRQGLLMQDEIADEAIQPSAIDLHLGDTVGVYPPTIPNGVIDMRETPPNTIWQSITDTRPFYLQPNKLVVAHTVERVKLPPDIEGKMDGRSTLSRLGIATHITAGKLDPGFEGDLVMALKNLNEWPFVLYPGLKIGQITFFQLDQRAERPYGSDGLGSHYQRQSGPVGARWQT